MRILNNTVLPLAVVWLVIVMVIRASYMTTERDRWKENAYSLMEGMEKLKGDSALQAARIRAMTLSMDEYENARKADAETIRRLGVRLGQVTAAARQEMEVKAEVTAMEDTARADSVRTFIYRDEHLSFTGMLRADSLKAAISIPVTLRQAIYKVPKHKFLWWSWGCKGIRQVVMADNPNVHLKYAEYIEIR